MIVIYHDGDFDGEFRVTLMVNSRNGDFHGWFMVIYPWIKVIWNKKLLEMVILPW